MLGVKTALESRGMGVVGGRFFAQDGMNMSTKVFLRTSPDALRSTYDTSTHIRAFAPLALQSWPRGSQQYSLWAHRALRGTTRPVRPPRNKYAASMELVAR